MRIYEPVIAPMDGPDMWEPTGLAAVQPPNYEPKRGKLARNRRKEPDEIEASKRKAAEIKKQRREKKKKQLASSEMDSAAINVTKLTKKGKLGRCSKCLQTGHNKTTCKKNNDSVNSTTPHQASSTETVQDCYQNASNQYYPSNQVHCESTYWTGYIHEPSKLNPRRPMEDDLSHKTVQAQVGGVVINAEKYTWNGRNCISLQNLQSTSATMKSKRNSTL